MPTDLQKSVAGALLLGASLLSGNAVLITAAGGIGVNWASEGLAGLWQQARAAFAPGTPLTRAAEQAIQTAANQLQREYVSVAGAQADTRAFALLRDCAAATSIAQYPAGPRDPLAAQQALNAALDQLLFGHDERAIALIRARLLDTTAAALRAELAGDAEAWRLFHGWLIEQLASQAGAMAATLERLPSVLAQLADQARARAALESAAARIEMLGSELRAAIARLEQPGGGEATTFENVGVRTAQLNQSGRDIVQGGASTTAHSSSPARPASFRNQDVTITGSLNQAGGNIYLNSAHAEGGSAIVVNNRQPASSTPAQAEPRELLTLSLSFTPTPGGAEVRWVSGSAGTTVCSFSAPYPGDDLPLIIRALDAAQHPSYPFAENEREARLFDFSAAEQNRLKFHQLWDVSGQLATSRLHRQVGSRLLKALTDVPRAAQALASARNHAAASGRPLALQLHFPREAIELAALPWELLWDDEPLPLLFSRSPHASIVRHLDLAPALPPMLRREGPLRILAITPSNGFTPKERESERAARLAAWQPLIDQGQVRLHEVGAAEPATPGAVNVAVKEHRPHLVYFHGHGRYRGASGELCFDGAADTPAWLGADRLAVLFGGARCVVLQACQSAMIGGNNAPSDAGLLTGITPALSAAGVPYVIGMQLTIRSEAAIVASAAIFQALSSRQSVQQAVGDARQALYVLEDEQCSWYVPALYIRARESGPGYV